MSKGTILGITLIIGVILGIALIDAGATRPIDWRRTFNIRDKIPYGLFVLHQELPRIMGDEHVYEDHGETTYEIISRLDSGSRYNSALLEISPYGYLDEEDTKKVLSYVKNGGEFFLSTDDLGPSLLDTLGLHVEELRYAIFYPTDKNITYSLGSNGQPITLDKVSSFRIFSKLDPQTCTIIGSLHGRGRAMPNFIKVGVGKGNLYIHLVPDVFTNYHMLTAGGYDYVNRALQVIQNKELFFSDEYFDWEQPRTPLRVILTQPGFYQAWYILLTALILLLVFRSRREQRAVKIVLPEPNLSKDFAKTIGNLYYESGHPGNMLHKKIEYFMYAIRVAYQLDTLDIGNDRFIRQLALKSGVDLDYTQTLMERLVSYRKQNTFTTDDVKSVNQHIEEFKSKANIV